ncbi:MAG: hypothetical protein ABI192_08690 [Bradyrhizobium sp.]
MTLLTHDHGSSYYPVRRNRKIDRAQAPADAARESVMRRFFRFAVTIFLITAVLAAIIALKTEIYLSHFNQ